jgi:hypothetical protein
MSIRKVRHKLFVALLPLCLFLPVSAFAQRAPSCQIVSFKVVLNANSSYERELGGGLLFRVTSGKGPSWFVDVVPAEENTKDYVYPVNLPLRFNPNQTLGAGNGETVQSSLSHPHDMNFLLDRSEYDRISALIPNVLRSYQTADPDRAVDVYSNAVENARKGSVHIAISSYKTDPKAGALLHIKLRVSITTPLDFQFAPGLNAWPSACPR